MRHDYGPTFQLKYNLSSHTLLAGSSSACMRAPVGELVSKIDSFHCQLEAHSLLLLVFPPHDPVHWCYSTILCSSQPNRRIQEDDFSFFDTPPRTSLFASLLSKKEDLLHGLKLLPKPTSDVIHNHGDDRAQPGMGKKGRREERR